MKIKAGKGIPTLSHRPCPVGVSKCDREQICFPWLTGTDTQWRVESAVASGVGCTGVSAPGLLAVGLRAGSD